MSDFKIGLVSISFRENTPEEILSAMEEAGLSYIEWGSDVQAPKNNTTKINRIAELQKKYGIQCCSYGTYFRLGSDKPEEISDYINTAKKLGTNILRIWCGSKSADKYSSEEKQFLFSDAKTVTEIAEKNGAILCLECHNDTFTETLDGSLEIIKTVNSPSFRMYWQPNQNRSIDENIIYAKEISGFTYHIHTFQWKENERYPLSHGTQEWKDYLECFDGEHMLLLEFMPDDKIESLNAEADSLRSIIGGLRNEINSDI